MHDRYIGMRAFALVVVLLAACGGGLASASASPLVALSVAELKYRVMDTGGRIEFCDPDFYPIARANEEDLAKAKLAEIQRDTETYAAITKRVGTDALAVYREWKALNALVFGQLSFGAPSQPQAYPFNYRSTGGPSATASKASGTQIEGNVDLFGNVAIGKRTNSGPLNCPICLARDTRIATPAGDVAVQDLRVGDIVWTIDAGVRVARPIVAVGATPVPGTHEVVRVVLADGRVVRASPGHPTTDGRVVGALRRGDTLDASVIVSAVRERYEGGFTYDVRPAGTSGAYWANGVLLASTIR